MSDPEKEVQLLERYARATNEKVLYSQSDLNPHEDKPLMEMVAWCKEHPTICVIRNKNILTSQPTSRDIQNCKSLMINKGMVPGKVIPTVQSVIEVLLANVEVVEEAEQEEEVVHVTSVSDQQQRLRILIEEGLKANASDVHIEVRRSVAKVRFRRNGELYLHAEWLPQVAREIAAVAFNKETDHATAHFNPNVPQDASMPMNFGGKEIRLRLASMPAHGGFDMVMRILGASDANVISLEQLGYTADQVALIKRAVMMPHGAIIMSGPTGSGKTTTLASCMNMVESSRKVYTIEDPVEKVVESITQVPVNTEKADRSFASMGRASLRMDPDCIVLGEMRDEDTVKVMVRAAITGHLVLTTVHTNSALAIITRLIDMGVSPMLLGDSNLLVCLIYQRLAPTLCTECCIPLMQSEVHKSQMQRWMPVFGDKIEQVKVRGDSRNCRKCHGTGIGGRTVLAEVVWVDENGRKYIQNSDTFGWEQYLKKNGWKSTVEHAIRIVLEGRCDPLDAERIIGPIGMMGGSEGFNYTEFEKVMQ